MKNINRISRMDDIRNLLAQVSLLTQKSDEILDATGSRFNMFKILGVNHYENTHSTILAEFLNPQGTHSVGDSFLREFTKLFCTDFEFDCANARVFTEKSSYEGRMDIVVESRGKALIIENKIYAADQNEQLKRYEEYAKSTYSNGYVLFYLNLWGNEASENSGAGVKYKTLSYHLNIIQWLELCARIAYDKPMLRETINQYTNHLKELAGMNIEREAKEEILNLLLKDKENFQAATQIVRAYESEARERLFQEVFQKKLRAILEEINCEVIPFKLNHYDKHWYKIYIRPSTWRNYEIAFEFGCKKGIHNMYYGVIDPTKGVSPNEELAAKLKQIVGAERSPVWLAFIYLPNHRNWTDSEYFMMYEEDSSLYNDFIQGVQNILAVTKGLDM